MLDRLRQSFGILAPILALGLLAGCGGDEDGFTVDVAGSYTVAVTNRESSCQMGDWMEGNMAAGIPFDVTQEGQNVHATVGGAVGVYVLLVQGNADFDGSVDGTKIALTNYGMRSVTQGNCTFTYNATIAGELNDDAISGTITYAPATNENPDCSDVECASVQEFSGSRPPR